MSVAEELKQSTDSGSEPRSVLGPGGNRVRVLENKKKESSMVKKTVEKTKQTTTTTTTRRKVVSRIPAESITKCNTSNSGSVNSVSSLDSSSSGSSVKVKSFKARVKQNGVKSGKVAPERDVDGGLKSPELPLVVKRCDWITPNSDPLYASFHDEEWGVPVHDDNKLFELLVLSQALAEHSWPSILNQRQVFRELFDNFDITSVAKFTEKKLVSLKANGNSLLSEPKLRAITENAKQILKVQQEMGSFNNYCWSFVNHKPIKNTFRYARQVPVKTPKADAISKDLMRRGFRCVGPTVVYSFMQVTGIVNDHLTTCFRHHECDSNVKRHTEGKIQETELAKSLEKTCLASD